MKEEYSWESTNCAVHHIQLCVDDGLKINDIAWLVGTCRKLVNHFRHSTIATAALADRQKCMSMPVKSWYKIVPPGETALIIYLRES